MIKRMLIKLCIKFLSTQGYISRNLVEDYYQMMKNFRAGYQGASYFSNLEGAVPSIYDRDPMQKHLYDMSSTGHAIDTGTKKMSRDEMNAYIYDLENNSK